MQFFMNAVHQMTLSFSAVSTDLCLFSLWRMLSAFLNCWAVCIFW